MQGGWDPSKPNSWCAPFPEESPPLLSLLPPPCRLQGALLPSDAQPSPPPSAQVE